MLSLEMRNCNMILTEKQQKYQNYHRVKLINMNILQVKNITSQSKENVFTYSTPCKAFKNQIKTIEDLLEKQIKALEEHEKQLIKSSGRKESLTLLKQKEVFEKFTNKRMDEIENLNKLISII